MMRMFPSAFSVFVIAILLLQISPLHSYGQKIAVNFEITQTAEYCGGAMPTDDILEQLRTARPLPDYPVYLRKGKENCLSKKSIALRSDSTGKIHTELSPGFYSVVGSNKADRSYYNQLRKKYSKATPDYGKIDEDCLNKWIKTPLTVIEVKEDGNTFKVNFHQPCPWHSVPCVQYTGPYPP